jgi:hypothetical protein
MDEIDDKVKAFLMYFYDPKSPFETVFNGADPSRPRIYFKKGMSDKVWLLEEVWKYWTELK